MQNKLFINGAYVPAVSGDMFDVVDPATNMRSFTGSLVVARRMSTPL